MISVLRAAFRMGGGLFAISLLYGQIPLNLSPSRVVGHPQLAIATQAPNLVEGREFNAPQGVAVDEVSGIVYVADSANHRVLAFTDAQSFLNGAQSILVLGQRDKFSTLPLGPGTSFTSGLAAPTGVAVDSQGNVYVADAGNNRIVRYPRPSSQPAGEPILADFLIGQTNFSGNRANQGGAATASTLAFNTSSGVFKVAIRFDASGNLWVTDAGNHRVLRYPASALSAGAANAPAADVSLGQTSLSNNTGLPSSTAANVRQAKNGLREPASLAFDQAGRLFVIDGLNRVMVYVPPFNTGLDASRIMGIIPAAGQGQTPPKPINAYSIGVAVTNPNRLLPAQGIFCIGNIPIVVDTPTHRLVRYDPFDQWPSEAVSFSPPGRAFIGQNEIEQDTLQENRGLAEPTANTFRSPADGVYSRGEVFLVDSGNNRVLAMPDLSSGPSLAANAPYSARRVLGQVGFEFRSPNLIEGREVQFAGTEGVAGAVVLDNRSTPPRMYVVDPNNHRVLGFADARNVRPGTEADIVIGQPDKFRALRNYPFNKVEQRNESSLLFPVAAAVDVDGNLWVADQANSRVLRFPSPFNASGPLPMKADLVLGQSNFTIAATDATARTMGRPSGLAFTAEGNLLVADSSHNRVLLFKPPFQSGMAASTVIGQPDFGSIGAGAAANRLSSPQEISTDTDDRLYVSDSANNRVQIFDRVTIASNGPNAAFSLGALSGLRTPTSVYVNPNNGEIWVADSQRFRMLRFPRFDVLVSRGDVSDYTIPLPTNVRPLGSAVDAFGALYVTDTLNRVGIYYPGVIVQNGANYLTRIAPGLVTTLSSRNLNYSFTDATRVFNELPNPIPMPRNLADIQVLIDEQPVPLYFISPFQINFLMPNGAPSSGTVELQVVQPSTGRVIAATRITMDVASPAFFTVGSTGTGQIASLNQDNSINSDTNQLTRGQVIQLFATGAGHIPNAPPDGEQAQGAIATPTRPRVVVGAREPEIQYSGLAPGLLGVWQINVVVPDVTAPSNQVLVVMTQNSIPSNNPSNPNQIRTTIAVK
ncbi:MAG: hypothetical protein J0L64_04060 [Acidobacteria bacterium]|nr:hypothetical protein [Acidobacteriota bacterium]